MSPELPVQRQLDAYNACDLERFVAEYADDVQLFRPPEPVPFITGKQALAEHYAAHRFGLPGLRAQLVNRMVLGDKVVDHELIEGVRPEPYEAVVVFQVKDALISRAWFFGAD